MKLANKFFFGLLSIYFSLVSCNKETIDSKGSNTVFVEFDNRIGVEKIVLGTTKGKNTSGETYTVSTLNYFISNVQLQNDKGVSINFPDQYFLVRQADAHSQTIELKNVPAGTYHHLVFTLGVDSLKSVAPLVSRTGVLDPASYGTDNMYWDWNPGYIFFKFEGNSSAAVNQKQEFQYHIGGYGGRDAKTPNNIRQIELHMHDPAQVSAGSAPKIHLIFDVNSVFDGANKLHIGETPYIHSPTAGLKVSENYSMGFIADHVHNDAHH